LKKIAIINGPNLNLTGKREPEIYGSVGFDEFIQSLKQDFKDQAEIEYFQSNIEGEIINAIQQKGFSHNAIIINAGAYSHTSIAIADALRSVPAVKYEVHLSNIFAREHYRHHSYISEACKAVICGIGLQGYVLLIQDILKEK